MANAVARRTACITALMLTFTAPLNAQDPIDRKYAELGGVDGFLGAATNVEQIAPDGTGHYRHFQGGSIYWTPRTGAYEVHGLIREKWSSLGWERSSLGYPLTDELPCKQPDLHDRYQLFQGGRLFWHWGATEAVSISNPTPIGDGGNCTLAFASDTAPTVGPCPAPGRTATDDGSPIERKILDDGTIELRFASGLVVRKQGGCVTRIEPGGQPVKRCFAPLTIPFNLPPLEGAGSLDLSRWLNGINDGLLSDIRTLLRDDSLSIDNYLKAEQELHDVYGKVERRAAFIQRLVR
jgi:hypothetical protein